MTASHRRHLAALAASFLAVGALSACTNTNTPSSPSRASVECGAKKACATETISVGVTSLTVTADASGKGQTVTAELTSEQQLHCSTVTSGAATATFSNTADDAGKKVTYSLSGAPAVAEAESYRAHPSYLGCFGSQMAFLGYVNGRRGPAVRNDRSGLYEAALMQCGRVEAVPCFRFAAGTGDTVTLTIETAPGDPRTVG